MARKLSNSDFDEALKQIQETYTIIAPKRFEKRGRFSDTDLIRYDKISQLKEIEWKEKSNFSPKEVVFPITQTLFNFTEDKFCEPKLKGKPVLVFMRACDINGFRRLDEIYLNNGENPDYYYKRLRERIKIVLFECEQSFTNCFCVSMKSNTTDEYDLALKFGEKEISLDVKDNSLSKYFDDFGSENDYIPKFIEDNEVKVTLPKIEEMPKEIFSHKFWDEYTQRCIACGRCNTTCTTCTCHTTTDIFYDDNPNAGERRRTWAACHIDEFSLMAGGHDFRENNGSRMRFKTMHKIYDYNKRFGEHMCIGCGRCDDNCPEYISFSNCINKLNNIL